MRYIVITGANKGIGYATVKKILKEHEDCFVFLGSRDNQRGKSAMQKLLKIEAKWECRLSLLPLDVTDEKSVRDAAKQVSEALKSAGNAKLYGLVNNAGVADLGATANDPKELKRNFDVNVLGAHRVTEYFIPMIDEKEGRVVMVSSAAGAMGLATCSKETKKILMNPKVTWEEIVKFMDGCLECSKVGVEEFEKKGYGEGKPYYLSKACLNAATLYFANKYPSLKINGCTPGFIETDLTRPYAEKAGKSPKDMGMKSTDEGAKPTCFCLFSELNGNGRYYGSDCKRSPLDRYRAPGDPEYKD